MEPPDPGARSIPGRVTLPVRVIVTPGVFAGVPGCVVPSMVTFAVTDGSSVWRSMVCGHPPGMSNEIAPPLTLAALIASRSEQTSSEHEPSLESAFVLTTKVVGGFPLAVTHGENSEVLPSGAVAVAVTMVPDETVGNDVSNDPAPLPSVVTSAVPR